MEHVKEGGAFTLAVVLSTTEFMGIDMINKYLAAAVSLCLITYYILKIFKKVK